MAGRGDVQKGKGGSKAGQGCRDVPGRAIMTQGHDYQGEL